MVEKPHMLPIDNGVDILSFTLHESTLGWQNRLGEAPDQSHAKSAWPNQKANNYLDFFLNDDFVINN